MGSTPAGYLEAARLRYGNRKNCSRCKNSLPIESFYQRSGRELGQLDPKCKGCQSSASVACYRKKKYGIPAEDFDAMLESQGGCCALCKQEIKSRPSLDHDHTTGAIRAILCINCNTGLGAFKDDCNLLLAAIDYLKEHRWTTTIT